MLVVPLFSRRYLENWNFMVKGVTISQNIINCTGLFLIKKKLVADRYYVCVVYSQIKECHIEYFMHINYDLQAATFCVSG